MRIGWEEGGRRRKLFWLAEEEWKGLTQESG